MVFRGERVALYARVSTSEQTTENQVLALKEWASRNCEGEPQIYEENESTKKTRPVKEEVKRRARAGELDAIVFVRLDRWGRSLRELVVEIEEFSKLRVALISTEDNLEFNTPAGMLHIHLLSAFTEFERALISTRTKEGLARAISQGKTLGRPKGSRKKVRRR